MVVGQSVIVGNLDEGVPGLAMFETWVTLLLGEGPGLENRQNLGAPKQACSTRALCAWTPA
jgi:hypothetical protein